MTSYRLTRRGDETFGALFVPHSDKADREAKKKTLCASTRMILCINMMHNALCVGSALHPHSTPANQMTGESKLAISSPIRSIALVLHNVIYIVKAIFII